MSGPDGAKECPRNSRWKFCHWYPSSTCCSNKTPLTLSGRGACCQSGTRLKPPLATLAIALSERGRDATGELHSLVVLMERRIHHHLGRARAAALRGRRARRHRSRRALTTSSLGSEKSTRTKELPLTQSVPPDLAVACEQQDFDEMAANLLENAFRWARNKVAIRAQHDDGRLVAIVIEDDGPRLRPDQIPQALRPGERIDESAPGFGFGLPITPSGNLPIFRILGLGIFRG